MLSGIFRRLLPLMDDALQVLPLLPRRQKRGRFDDAENAGGAATVSEMIQLRLHSGGNMHGNKRLSQKRKFIDKEAREVEEYHGDNGK